MNPETIDSLIRQEFALDGKNPHHDERLRSLARIVLDCAADLAESMVGTSRREIADAIRSEAE